MHDLTRVIIRSGLIEKDTLAQFQKWGLLVQSIDPPPMPTTPEKLVEQLDRALQEEDMVMVRETDLNVVQTYLKTMRAGMLHLILEDGMVQGQTNVTYGVSATGEYLIPWMAEALDDLLINGATYLLTVDGKKVYFSGLRELFFGEQKAFIACKSSSIEESNEHQQAIDAPKE